jgi:hypothetical protein
VVSVTGVSELQFRLLGDGFRTKLVCVPQVEVFDRAPNRRHRCITVILAMVFRTKLVCVPPVNHFPMLFLPIGHCAIAEDLDGRSMRDSLLSTPQVVLSLVVFLVPGPRGRWSGGEYK